MIAKYRGKRIDNNEWVYGVPVYIEDKCWIVKPDKFKWIGEDSTIDTISIITIQVDPATVGQWTGVIGVYEGDIVEGQSCGRSEPVFDYRGVIEYFTEAHVVGWHVVDIDGGAWELQQICARISMEHISGCVIGNIHDNPELVKP